jgi:fatty-acyl-CoA synthase
MKIEETVVIGAPPQAVWEAVADPVAISHAIGPAMRVQPEDEDAAPGLGVRYRVLVRLGAALVGGQVEIVEWEPGRELAWVALRGVSHRLRLRIRPTRDGGTTLTLRFAYDAPGVLGTLADVAALPRMRTILRDGLATIAHGLDPDVPPPAAPGPSLVGRGLHEAGNVAVLARSGLVRPMRPDKVARIALAARTWGPSLSAAVAIGAIRHGRRALVEDHRGTLTYADADRRSDAIAVGLQELGVGSGAVVALMARNHRGFVEAAAAAAKAGADVLLLNTAFAGPQLTDVCAREQPTALLHDAEFSDLLGGVDPRIPRVLTDAEGAPGHASLDALAEAAAGRRPSTPEHTGRVTILTSGTTGTPKGATRSATAEGRLPSLDAPAGLLERIPLKEGMRVGLPSPMFHAWGLGHLAMGLGLGATFVVSPHFDPAEWRARIRGGEIEALVVVPVMLPRILELPPEQDAGPDASRLRVVAASGSALPGDLSTRWMDEYGDTLYNLYGSTEIASVSIATPRDLRAAPGTAGRPARGTTVKLLDADGHEVEQGRTGRIFVGSSALFDGYTTGGDKERIRGLASSGDVGRFDETGRLFVEGRDDEMIVSGGENVFPKEIEDTLARHPAVVEAAAIGVDDPAFGQRLQAFVVVRDGAQATEDELKAHVKDELARFKVPREIVFVDVLPRNATGKVLKRELRPPGA